jgi:hypothetical protein
MVTTNREVVKHRFLQQQIDILICTDAAAEGLNLQTADLLVNFDLPWNPMKVEQRIGRIDRIGQTHEDINVLNLCYLDSAEQIVYGRLLQRLTNINAVVGTQQLALLPVSRDEFKQLAEKTVTEAEVERRAIERAQQAQHRTSSMEMPPQDLYQTYLRMEQQRDSRPVPVDLDAIWETLSHSDYLRALGCQMVSDEGHHLMRLSHIPSLPDGTAVTTSRILYDRGAPDVEGRLHFATYGDPAFEAILAHMDSFGLPGCLRRLEIGSPTGSVSLVGYAVAHLEEAGHTAYRLVTSMRDTATLRLHEEAQLTDADVEPLRQTLATIAHADDQMHLPVSRIELLETLNETAARSQVILNNIVLRGIIQGRQRTGGAAPQFSRELAELEAIFQIKDQCIRVRQIPSEHVQALSGQLFSVTIPANGDMCHLDAPRPLLLAALDAAHRLVTRMREKRSELLTDAVVARLNREIDQALKQLLSLKTPRL